VKVLLTLDGGFSKEIFNGDKAQVKTFLEGYKEVMPLVNTSTSKEDLAKKLLSVIVMAGDVAWMLGAIARLDNSQGKLEVVE
jgi:hypothetical protein